MTPAVAPKEAKKDAPKPEGKDAKKDSPTGQTIPAPLKGGKDGVTRTLDNKDVLKAPVDKKVLAAAEAYASILDRQAKTAKEGEAAAQELLKALDESKKAKKVRVVGEMKTYWFSKATLSKLVVQKKDANEA